MGGNKDGVANGNPEKHIQQPNNNNNEQQQQQQSNRRLPDLQPLPIVPILPAPPTSNLPPTTTQQSSTKYTKQPWRPEPFPPNARPATVVVMPRYLQDQQNNNEINISTTTTTTNIDNNIVTMRKHTNKINNNNNNNNNNIVNNNVNHNNNSNRNSTITTTTIITNGTNNSNRNSGNNNHIYVNPYSMDTNLEASLTGAIVTLDHENQLNNNNNNNGTIICDNSNVTGSTINTYLFPCGADSAGTIGGVTLNSGSGSCDLGSNFSQMVAGSIDTVSAQSSTLSAGLGFINKRRIRRLFGGTDITPYASAVAIRRRSANLARRQQERLERQTTLTAANVAYYEQQARLQLEKLEGKKKKKKSGPPPQVRAQATRQLDDPMMNRPRRQTPNGDKKKKKQEELELRLALANEKYLALVIISTTTTPTNIYATSTTTIL